MKLEKMLIFAIIICSLVFTSFCNVAATNITKTLYDDKIGLTRIIPVLLTQNRLILALLTGILLAILGVGIGYLFRGGS